MSSLSFKSGSEVVSPNNKLLDTYCFDVDLTATDLLDVADPVDGEDFVVTFSLDGVVPVGVPGGNAIGTEVEEFVLVAVINAVACPKC